MKQTVVLLTALVFSLMIVTGFILVGSIRQTEMLQSRDEMLMQLRQERTDLSLENTRLSRELTQTLQERQALTQQLNEAVLASQEANDAVAFQTAQNDALEEALHQATLELDALRLAMQY